MGFYKHLCLLVLYVTVVLKVGAQSAPTPGKLTGKVFNKRGDVLSFVTVDLRSFSDSSLIKATLTDEHGEFTFSNLSFGSYILLYTAVGYSTIYSQPYTINGTNNSFVLDKIILSPSVKELTGVTVLHRKPLIEHKDGKIILNVANSSLASSNSAWEILSKAPGVTISPDGDISLRGKSGTTIMLDGKLTYLSSEQLATLLKSTDGNSIQYIEIITNPSAKYDASGSAGIINIKIKKNNSLGTNGSLFVSGGYGTYYKSSTGVSINHRDKHINLYGNYNYTNNKEFQKLSVNRSNSSDSKTTFFKQAGLDIYNKYNHSYKAGLDYYFNSNNILGIVLSGFDNKNLTDANVNTYIGNSAVSTDSSILATNPAHAKFKSYTFNLNFKSVLDTLGQDLNIDLDFSQFKVQNTTEYNNSFFDGAGQILHSPVVYRNLTPSTVRIFSGKLDYVYSIRKLFKLETGIKSSYVRTNNNFLFDDLQYNVWQPNISKSNDFEYSEYINAAYAMLYRKFGATSVQLGIRAEATTSKGKSIVNSKLVDRNYLNLFPSLYIGRTFHERHEFGFTYSKRIDRPDYQALNPFIYNTDLYTFQQGNPLLNPQFTNSFDISYTYNQNLNLSLGYSYTRDVITTTLRTDTLRKTLTLFDDNLASQATYTLNGNLPITISKWWNSNNDATLYFSKYSSPNLMGAPFKSKQWTYLINSLNTFRLSPLLNSEISLNYQSKQIYGTYIIKPLYSVDIGISKTTANKKFTIKLAANDVFNMRKAVINSAILSQDYRLTQKQESRIFKLTLTYNFGSKSFHEVRERSSGSSSEQSRIKTRN
jgi:outer membrane receptor protein involved in Fe transport